MRSSPPGTLKTRSPRAEKRPTLLAALLITCACAASYVAGLHAAKCKFTATYHGTASPASLRPGSIPAAFTPLSSPAGDQRSTGALGHAPKGRHILLEYYHIPGHLFAPLTDTARLRHALTVLIQQSGMTYLGNTCHVFEGTEGVTCVFLLSESHISIHTWPEHGYAALDIFTCGVSAHPEVMEQGLQELLQPGLVLRQEQPRGGLNTSLLSPEQRTAKVLHTFMTNGQDGESLQQLLFQVPVLHSTSSHYQSLSVVEVPGQLGRCLLLDGTIQFCSHDLDAYTDHMGRHPLQLLQAVRGCGPAAALPGTSTGGPSADLRDSTPVDALHVTVAVLPPAASSTAQGHVTCRKSLLQPATRVSGAATAGASNGSTADLGGCLGPQQTKARVLLVGGGDGWIAGHLISCYGDYVESVTAVELDEMVSDVTETYFRPMMHHGSPFKHPRITWEYTDAYAWAVETAARCSSTTTPDSAASNNSTSTSTAASGPAAKTKADTPAVAATARRQLQIGSAGNSTSAAHTMHASRSSSSNNHGLNRALDCAGFDVVIIDSTDFTVADASKLHSVPFYAALHQLAKPQAALIQIVEIYMRVFEKDFAAMEAALQGAGWAGVGRSSVFTPSYGGEALMLHAVKR